MFLLNFVSTTALFWIAHAILAIGVIGYFASNFAGVYKYIAKPVAVVLVVVGAFLEGNLYGTSGYLTKVKEMEDKVNEAKQQSAKVNTVIKTKIIEKVKVVKENTNANVQVVEKIVTKYDNICTLSNAAISVHNSASQNAVAPSSGAAIEGTSDVKISELVRTVTENYGTYYEMRELLLGWQQWYREQQKIYELSLIHI